MFRAIPTNNKLCFDADLKRSWKIHQHKLKNIKSSINQSPPSHYVFLDQRAKRSALEDVRNIEIEKQNHSLLGRIQNTGNNRMKSLYMRSSSGFEKKKTLNEGYRKKELVKIVEENQEIIKRISSKKSMYNVKKWGKERQSVQKNITLISSYPYKNYPPTTTQTNFWMTDEGTVNKSRAENIQLSRTKLLKHDLYFSGTHQIGQNYYLVETKVENKKFTIEVENLEDFQEKYKLQMGEKEVYDLLQNNFEGKLKNLFNNLWMNKNEGICELKCFSGDKSDNKRSKKQRSVL